MKAKVILYLVNWPFQEDDINLSPGFVNQSFKQRVNKRQRETELHLKRLRDMYYKQISKGIDHQFEITFQSKINNIIVTDEEMAAFDELVKDDATN
jgi:hypothetical protein